jgi:nitroreductase
MDVYEATIKRRAIRRFQNKPVPYGILKKCVDAARMAPNGHNHQILEFIVADDEKIIPDVVSCLGRSPDPSPKDDDDRPQPGQYPRAFIAILINTVLETATGVPREGHMPAVGAAAENAMLVALENGISSCPMMGFDRDTLKQLLKIPDKYDIPMLISLGYPAEVVVADEASSSVERWVDEQGVRHIPKRRLVDILHRNKFTKSDYNKPYS